MSATILVLADYYLPGWKAGGPIHSISNMVEAIGDRYEFLILTRNHDHPGHEPYRDVTAGRWADVGKASVYYGQARHFRPKRLRHLIRETNPDLLFANSLFSTLTFKVLILRWLRRIDRVPILVAPRGQFGAEALRYFRLVKRPFLFIGRRVGWFNQVTWQASTSEEATQITRQIKSTSPFVAADVPRLPESTLSARLAKEPGSVKLVFTARISPMKNLPFLLRALVGVSGSVTLDIYGAAEPAEWRRVEPLVDSMPDNMTVNYRGAVRPEEIDGALAQAHFSVLATRGENFGHSVYEALRVGRPVVVSDRAPWRGLEDAHAGWSIPLESREEWTDALQRCVDIGEDEYREMSVRAHEYAQTWFASTRPVEQQVQVFESLIKAEST